MKQIHTPRVDARYWTAITLASVFGTNMGDLYAHESGLGMLGGWAVLALLTLFVFIVEGLETRRHQVYYWMVIILIRTGATNIADYLAYRVHVPDVILTVGLIVLLALFGWGTSRSRRAATDPSHSLPPTNAASWLAMLSAGVFGTVVGDICEHAMGEGSAALALTAVLLAVLLVERGSAAQFIALYWTTVAVARTAGTAIGDWVAENELLPIGLRIATFLSGIAFAAVLLIWRTSARPRTEPGEELASAA